MSEPTINFHVQTRLAQFKIPTELIKKNFKVMQKQIEKQKKQLTEDLAHIKKNPTLPTATKLEIIRKLIKNFEAFQKRLQSAMKKDEELRSRLVARLQNLEKLKQFTVVKSEEEAPDDRPLDLHNVNLINWYRDQSNLLIIDYLIKSNTNYEVNVGIKLLESFKNSDLDKLIDADLFENFNKVFVSMIEDHNLSPVTSWYNENKNSLKKITSNLEFEINYCKFLSLIKEGNVTEAAKYSQTHLSPYGNKDNYPDDDFENYESNIAKLKQAGGLFVYASTFLVSAESSNFFSENILVNSPQFQNYIRLLSDERWRVLSTCFIKDFNKIYGISKTYPLFVYLSAGLSSLKTKSCYCNTENTIFNQGREERESREAIYERDLAVLTDKKYRGPNQYYKLLNKINHCPVCSPELFAISRNLPYAQLITHIFDDPYKLPNGNIYPFDKLLNPSDKYLSEKNTLLRMGKVKDPLTREIFLIDNCVRVFPA